MCGLLKLKGFGGAANPVKLKDLYGRVARC